MIEGSHRAWTDVSSSGAFREAILARHDVLRGLVADTVHLADRRPRARRDVDRLRARARDLYLTLADDVMNAGLGRFPTATKKLSALLA